MPNTCQRAFIVAALVLAPSVPLVAQGGASGVHANEAFCTTMMKQADLAAAYMKSKPGLVPDEGKQATYFSDQKALNAALVKTAPASLNSDIVNFTRVSNAYLDAQLAGRKGDKEARRSAAREMASPEHIAQSKRMGEYCGVKAAASH